MNRLPLKKISLYFILFIFVLAPIPTMGERKIEKVPASLLITAAYGEGKNRDSYLKDVLRSVENYLLSRGCFERLTTDSEEKTELSLSFFIDKLEFRSEYGSSLGAMMSDQVDPSVKLQQVSHIEFHIFMQFKNIESDTILMQKDIQIREARQKMTLDEDTYQYLWNSALNSLQEEVEKKICRKYKKTMKALSLK